MTIRFNHTNHKKLWHWLAEHPDMSKSEWPGWEYLPPVPGWCFACAAVNSECELCPLNWGIGVLSCTDSGGYYNYYSRYKILHNMRKIKKYAKIIAELPLRKLQGHELVII